MSTKTPAPTLEILSDSEQSHNAVCCVCNREFDPSVLIEFTGELYCGDCFDRETVECSRCGERIHYDDNAGNDDLPLCSGCYDEHYVRCEHCGNVIRRIDAYFNDCSDPFCEDCYYSDESDSAIEDYFYKPSPIFYGEGDRFFGVELEVDEGGECDDNAEIVINIANRDCDRIYCKHDGSLNDGFEIVTHPMTLEYHVNSMPWSAVMDKLLHMGYLSHQASTCGLHIHVNRTAFGETNDEQDECIGRLLYFFEKHWDELLKFSRRTQRQLDRWAARYGYKDHPKEMLEHVKKGASYGRYVCINLLNHDTIEFRIFRGTLKLNTLIATLQLVNRVCNVAIFMSDDEVRQMSWTTFVSGCTEPELIQYLKERRIYINDLIETEDEI